MIADEHPVQAAGGDGKSMRAISHERESNRTPGCSLHGESRWYDDCESCVECL